MTKKALWVFDHESFYAEKPELETHMLIDADDIYEVADIYHIQVWENVPATQAERMRGKMRSTPQEDDENLEEYLDRVVGEEGDIYLEDYVSPGLLTHLVFDHAATDFTGPSDYIVLKAYSYWDGSNHQEIVLDDYYAEDGHEILIETTESYDLDIFDGMNRYWLAEFDHASVWKLAATEDVPESGKVLLEFWTQWQGIHPTGVILSREEVLEYLENHEHPELEEIREWLNK